jgi:hypothetical protein
MVHLGGGWLAGSVAERHDAHQHRDARTRRPDAVAIDSGVEVAAALVLSVEGVERVEQGHVRDATSGDGARQR